MDVEFEDFVTGRSPGLLRLAFLLSADHELAKDLVQDTLLKTYRAWPRVSAAGNPDAYVRRMITNEYLSWRRRWHTRNVTTGFVPELGISGGQVAVDDHEHAWQKLATLPPKQRAVLVLRFYADLSDEDIAHALGCSTATVRSQASRALGALRRRARPTTTGARHER